MHKFKKLKVWQKSMILVDKIYAVTRDFPQYEQFGLASQLRRAATAIVLNIAEGSGAGSNKEFKRFLRISLRSVYETITALQIAEKQKFITKGKYSQLSQDADEIAAMICGLIKSLASDD